MAPLHYFTDFVMITIMVEPSYLEFFKETEKAARDLTNSFHVITRLFSNRSQMTSKCGKNKNKEAHLTSSMIY